MTLPSVYRLRSLLLAALLVGCAPLDSHAQAAGGSAPVGEQAAQPPREHRAATVARFLGGAALALGAHEASHLLADVVFDADPALKSVDFHGIPFFAITHRSDVSPGVEFTISSAGFWTQHAGSEWLLTRRPRLRFERAPLAKGVLAFNVIASVVYSGAAFGRTGPFERDTRGMAASASIDERWIGALVLAPAAMDAWRYVDPDARWAMWASRLLKAGGVLLVVKAIRAPGDQP
jgi:hypothetical protein